MTENDLLEAVLSLARVLKWRTLHIRPARTDKGWRSPLQGDGVGWPDIFAVRGDDLLAVELKSDKGKLTKAQQEWLELLSPTCLTYVWTPADWPEPIHSILKGESP